MTIMATIRNKEQKFDLPGIMAVLVHLPDSQVLRDAGFYVAHALQYNISARGKSPTEAISRLLNLVAVHCRVALEQGIHPVNLAANCYLRAFFIGVPLRVDDIGESIDARMSRELATSLGAELEGEIRVDVRDICAMQNNCKAKPMTIEDFMQIAA